MLFESRLTSLNMYTVNLRQPFKILKRREERKWNYKKCSVNTTKKGRKTEGENKE